MASGYYTGYQHSLLDMEDLTQEKFIDWCDNNFFHMDHFGYKTVDEAKMRMRKNLADTQDRLKEYRKEYEELLSSSTDELRAKYDVFVRERKEANERSLSVYRTEMAKMAKIKEWSSYIPQMDAIWKGFKEPELYVPSVPPFEEWYKNKLNTLQRYIEVTENDVLEFEKKVEQDDLIIAAYEEAKQNLVRDSCAVV